MAEKNWLDEYFKGADRGIQDLIDSVKTLTGKKSSKPSSKRLNVKKTPRPVDPGAASVEETKRLNQRAKDLHRAVNGAPPRKKSEAELQADRLISEERYPRSFRPRGSGSSEYASQVPKARRELSETLFAQRAGVSVPKKERTSGGRLGAKSTGSPRKKASKASGDQEANARAVKRLGGKRPVKRGEI